MQSSKRDNKPILIHQLNMISIVVSFEPRPVVHPFWWNEIVETLPKDKKQSWFQKVFECESMTNEIRDFEGKKLERGF